MKSKVSSDGGNNSLMFSSKQSESSHEDGIQYKVYKRRYYMLALFSMCNLLNVMWCVSSFLIRYHYKDLYGISFFKARLASLLYPFLYLPAVLFAMFVYNRYSLRVAMYIGIVLLAVGASIKWLVNYSFNLMLVGQSICALSWPFFINAPALLATRWFESSKKVLAITIGSNLSIVGIFIGGIIPRIIVDRDYKDEEEGKIYSEKDLEHQIALSFMIQAGVCIILMILVLTSFQNKPAVPPSPDALVYRDNDLLGIYRLLFTNGDFVKLTLTFSLYFANVAVLAVVSKEMATHYNYTGVDVEWFEVTNVTCGIIGSFAYGAVLHKFKLYKTANVAIGASTLISLWILTLVFTFENKWITGAMYGVVGFCCYPTVLICYAYSSEVAYPIKETTASGVYLLGVLLISTILTDALKYGVLRTLDSKTGTIISFVILILFTSIGLLLAIFMKPINYDRIAYIQNNVASGSFIADYARLQN